MTVEERFWAKVRTSKGCWEWTACTRNGYGRLGLNGGVADAHRLSWEMHYGQIPNGLCVLHHCDNRLCVRPDHLFLGTRGDNIADMDAKGRRGIYYPPAPLRCKRGHVYDEANTYMWHGQHHCRACRSERMRLRKLGLKMTA
jgi:hypothetical protein